MLDQFAEAFRVADAIAAPRPRYLWHIALTDPGKDKQAEDGLRRRGYRVERPKITVWKPKRGGGRKETVKSMFPGYQFVLPARHGWEALRESPGVWDLMRIDGHFVTLGDDDPEFRRIWEVEAQLKQSPQKTSKFRIGQRVGIKKGPFIDLMGNIEVLDGQGRVDVLIDLLKRKVRVTTSQEFLNPA